MIYDMATGTLIASFNTYTDNSYHNSNTVAYEPLEEGSFSSDSKQNSPALVSITAVASIIGDSSQGDTVDTIRTNLNNLCRDARLVRIVLQPMAKKSLQPGSQYYQYGTVYKSATLISIDYENNPEQLDFKPTMTFQQIRLTNTEYTNSKTTKNPENDSTANSGQVQPKNSSVLFNEFGELPL